MYDDNKQGNLDIFKGDIRDQDFLNKIFEKYNLQGQRIEGVIHFAGLKSVSESVFNPLSYWDSNVVATINLLNVIIALIVKL